MTTFQNTFLRVICGRQINGKSDLPSMTRRAGAPGRLRGPGVCPPYHTHCLLASPLNSVQKLNPMWDKGDWDAASYTGIGIRKGLLSESSAPSPHRDTYTPKAANGNENRTGGRSNIRLFVTGGGLFQHGKDTLGGCTAFCFVAGATRRAKKCIWSNKICGRTSPASNASLESKQGPEGENARLLCRQDSGGFAMASSRCE